jgi:hypothetical protein
MEENSLSIIALALGLGLGIPHLLGVWYPEKTAEALKKFPRSNLWGYILMGISTIWFIANVRQESIADFATMKKYMMGAFAVVGFGSCFFLKDFLAVRGLAVILLLLAKLTLDAARWHPSEWTILLQVMSYIWVFVGMWLTISPWRLRDWINWYTQSAGRVRAFSAMKVVGGLVIATLGFTVFRV